MDNAVFHNRINDAQPSSWSTKGYPRVPIRYENQPLMGGADQHACVAWVAAYYGEFQIDAGPSSQRQAR